MAEAASRAGTHLVCRPGCTPCCIGTFSITALDAWRLRRGLGELAEADPERAQAVVERARRAWDAQQPAFPGDPVRGLLGGDEAAEEAFCAAFDREPCPALDPDDGTCDLYASRPTSCRTFGPPLLTAGERLAPCSLCFTGASVPEIEHARASIDVSAVEDPLVDELTAAGRGRRHDRGRGAGRRHGRGEPTAATHDPLARPARPLSAGRAGARRAERAAGGRGAPCRCRRSSRRMGAGSSRGSTRTSRSSGGARIPGWCSGPPISTSPRRSGSGCGRAASRCAPTPRSPP